MASSEGGGPFSKALIKSVDSESSFSADPRPRAACCLGEAFNRELTIVTEEMQAQVVEMAVKALDQYNVEKDVAMWLKKEADRVWGTTWHCVVGKK